MKTGCSNLFFDVLTLTREYILGEKSFCFVIEPFNDQCSHHIETSHLIWRTNQLTCFYMMGTLVVKGLIFFQCFGC